MWTSRGCRWAAAQVCVTASLVLAAPALAQRNESPRDPQDPFPEVNVTQPDPFVPLDKANLQNHTVRSFSDRPDGVAANLGTYTALVRVLAPDLVHVSMVTGAAQPPTSPGILKRDWGSPAFTRAQTPTTYTLTTSDVRVEIGTRPFAIRLLDADTGMVINEDDTRWGSSGYENGKPYVFKRTDADESFYGWGEQTRGLNKRGESIGLWNTDAYSYTRQTRYIYTTIPFFIGLRQGRAYGLFFDNTWRSEYEMATDDESFYDFWARGGPLSYYLFAGPKVSDVIERYTELTGRFPQPPQWSLGWQQSKWQYTREQILDVANKYRQKGIPLDVMHLDIDYMDAYRVFTWGEKMPVITPENATDREHGGFIGDPFSFHAELNALNLHTIAINDPGVKVDPNYDVYLSGNNGRTADGDNYWAKAANGQDYVGAVWPKASKFPDFFRPEVRNWWAGYHNRLFDPGVDGIWLDMNEPADFVGPYHTLPLDATFDHRRISHNEGHNLYGFWETEATKRAFDQYKPNERAFILTRDMYSGSQRWAALWTGDNVSNWEHLRMSLPMNQNIGLSGIPMVGNDIGGFAQRPTAEMMKRWLEVGALMPFARVHYDSDAKATNPVPQEPFAETYGGDMQVEDVARRYVRLRYELLPYMQNLFRAAEQTGAPIWRPLLYEFQNDERTYDVEDQFMFGDRIMVAPIVDQGKERRRIYLPEGSRWVDYWNGTTFAGGRYIERQTGIETLPLYIRAGSIIPRRDAQMYTGERPLTNLILDTWMSANGTASTTYYEDDGATKDYQRGEYNDSRITVTRANGGFSINMEALHRGFDSPTTSYTLQLHNVTDSPVPPSAPVTSAVRGGKVRVSYNRKKDLLTIRMPATTRKVWVSRSGKVKR
jgi:alpha-glucosidase